MSKFIVDDETLQVILATLLGETENLDHLIPEYQLKGRGYKWYIDPSERKMVCVKGGVKCYLLNYNYNNENKYLLYTTTNHVILVDKRDVNYIGYN
jgi:hypothetical protein